MEGHLLTTLTMTLRNLTHLNFAVQSDSATGQTFNTPGTPREGSPEIFPPKDGFCDGTDTYSHMEPDAENVSEQPNTTLTNLWSTKYNSGHNPKPNCNDDY